jgi:pimeloyl-ACP methyl ester carboxylesterase
VVTAEQAIATLTKAFAADGLPALGSLSFDVGIGAAEFTATFVEGEVTFSPRKPGSRFRFAIGAGDWDKFAQEPPPRGYTTAQAMRATLGWECVTGERARWAEYATVVDRIFETLRQAENPRPARNDDPPERTGRSPIEGRYITVAIDGELQRIFVESSGSGDRTVLCLHTAGADARQFRYLLEDEELTDRYRFVAFDMPWHGRSDPPSDWQQRTYRLTTERYAATILAVMDELGLQAPVLMGCSMGGAIALYMACVHGERFTAALALEGGLGNPGRYVPWTNHVEVDHAHFLTSWVGGLIAPSSPTSSRSQTLWGYAQSGPGVYQGDTYFYSNDLPQIAPTLTRAGCPLWVFSGEYDYSATLEMSREAAERLGGTLVEMPRFGHFPMSEDPAVFRSYLLPVLDELEATVPAS